MADRRSGRSKKTIDYSKFATGDTDDDDDFKEASTQPNKRKKVESLSPKSIKVSLTKIDVGVHKKETKRSEKQPKNKAENVIKQRPSVNDKVFQRELNKVLEISKQETQQLSEVKEEKENCRLLSVVEEKETHVHDKTENSIQSITSDIVTSNTGSSKERIEIDTISDEEVDSSESEEDSEASDWSEEEKEISHNSSAKSNRVLKGNCSEEQESDFSETEIETKKKSAKQTARNSESKKETKTIITTKVSHPPTPVLSKSSRSQKKSMNNCCTSSSVKTGTMPQGAPCQFISSPVKLPPKGLRLGLSRKVPGKPLHSIIKVQP